MKKNNIHIVFGSIEKTFAASGVIESSEDRIIFFKDKLEYGPLCDIHDTIEKRKVWFSKVFGGTMFCDFITSNLENDLKEIQTMIDTMDTIDKVFLWTGNEAFEVVSTARILSHLSKCDHDFYFVDYSQIELTNFQGKKYSPKTISVIEPGDYSMILEKFKPVKGEEIEFWVKLWERLKKGDSELRVLENQNGISVKDVRYFDETLLSNCMDAYQKCSRVIGRSLFEIDFKTDEHFLNWRLKCLAQEGRIATKGELIEIRDYQVKKLT